MTTQDKAARDRAWNQANPERKLELNRRGNRALYHREKALGDIFKTVAAESDSQGGI
ncbi:MAG: hypothetical protein V3S60_01275 [Acidimicrobiia bacterium]